MNVKILDIPLLGGKLNALIKEIIETINAGCKKNYCISATGAHGLVVSKKNEEFANILKEFYCNLPDGMPGVWIGRLKGAKEMERCYGPHFFHSVIVQTAKYNINHYLCGGKEGIANELRSVCETEYENFNIVGTFSPPFREMTEKEFYELATEINSKKTDIVWIGLSTPKQEIFASRLAKYTKVGYIVTVGAAFDFHTGKIKQAPKILQRMGLEWLFRLLIEPKRLYKRYFEIVPKFIYYNMKELSTFLLNKVLRRNVKCH